MRLLPVVAISALGCGVLSQEAQLLTRFFEAARLHDTTVMAKYATITFNPVTQGVVHAFDVQGVEALDDTSKRATIHAHLRQPDGRMAERTMLVTMRRSDSGWIITDIAAP